MSRSTAETTVARVLAPTAWVVAGVMMLSTSMLRWVSSGPGSSFGGLELADNLRNGVLSPEWGVWVAVIFYSIVAVGGVLIATAMSNRRSVIIARGAMSVTGLVVFGILARVVLPIDNWGAGPTIASMSFLLATALSAYQLITSSGQ